MRRRVSRGAQRSELALWLDAVWCRDPEWQRLFRERRYAEIAEVVKLWRSWSGHRDHVLWWVA